MRGSRGKTKSFWTVPWVSVFLIAVVDAFPFRSGWAKDFRAGLRVDAAVGIDPVEALFAWLAVLIPPALLALYLTLIAGVVLQDAPLWLNIPLWFFLGPMSVAAGGFLAHGAVYVFGGSQATLLSDSMALVMASAAMVFMVLS